MEKKLSAIAESAVSVQQTARVGIPVQKLTADCLTLNARNAAARNRGGFETTGCGREQ
jgi:hypothetical protein